MKTKTLWIHIDDHSDLCPIPIRFQTCTHQFNSSHMKWPSLRAWPDIVMVTTVMMFNGNSGTSNQNFAKIYIKIFLSMLQQNMAAQASLFLQKHHLYVKGFYTQKFFCVPYSIWSSSISIRMAKHVALRKKTFMLIIILRHISDH